MKKILILLLAAIILLSGCVKTMKTGPVKVGDNISIDYIGSLPDGTVFDTSIEKVAMANNIYTPGREYKPLNFTVGKGEVIQGLDEGVVGMKVGESKVVPIPPEKAYGPVLPMLIQVIPRIQSIPATDNIPATQPVPKVLDVPLDQFESTLGTDHHVGEIVNVPGTNLNFTILNMNSSSVSISYNLKVGDTIWSSRAPYNQTVVKIDDKNITLKPDLSLNETIQSPGAPWNETVIKIDAKNITLKPDVSINQVIQLHGYPWNTTVIDINSTNITLRANAIPDTVIPTQNMFGQVVQMKISFNETSIIMDQNQKYAGKTLIFNVTLVSIQ